MATTQAQPAAGPARNGAREEKSGLGADRNGAGPQAAVAEQAIGAEVHHALVPAPHAPEAAIDAEFAAPITLLPVELGVAVPVRDFRVRQLLALTPGQVIETQWNPGDDLPLAAGDVQLAWSEFEVVDSRLAVRVTRLA